MISKTGMPNAEPVAPIYDFTKFMRKTAWKWKKLDQKGAFDPLMFILIDMHTFVFPYVHQAKREVVNKYDVARLTLRPCCLLMSLINKLAYWPSSFHKIARTFSQIFFLSFNN